jgi:hypothetical protein
MLVLSGVHIGAERIGCTPELMFEANRCGG